MRLHKYLAQAGVASRRSAEQMIREGRVVVNGETITELGKTVDPEKDRISVDGKQVGPAEVRTTIVLHKPMGVVTTMSDPEERRTVASLISEEPYRLVPVGRLDFNTEGVLLLTTDGELAHRLLHPRFKVPKVYTVKVAGHPKEKDLDRLRTGVELEDGMTQPAIVEVLEIGDKHVWLEIVISEGRQRQIRRMCEAIDHRALRVVRTSFATIDVEGLRPSEYRYLSKSELAALHRLVGLGEPGLLSERARQHGTRPLGVAERRKGALPGEEQGGRPRGRRRTEEPVEVKPRWIPRGPRGRLGDRGGPRADHRGRGPVRPRRSYTRAEPRSDRPRFSSDRSRPLGDRPRYSGEGPRPERRGAQRPGPGKRSEAQPRTATGPVRVRPRFPSEAGPPRHERSRFADRDARPRGGRPRSGDEGASALRSRTGFSAPRRQSDRFGAPRGRSGGRSARPRSSGGPRRGGPRGGPRGRPR